MQSDNEATIHYQIERAKVQAPHGIQDSKLTLLLCRRYNDSIRQTGIHFDGSNVDSMIHSWTSLLRESRLSSETRARATPGLSVPMG